MDKHYKLVNGKVMIPITTDKFQHINRTGRFLATMLVEGTKYLIKLNVRSKSDISVCCPLCDGLTTELYLDPFDTAPARNNIPVCSDCYGKYEIECK
ncbi:hypothetical protein ETI08_03830 [Macrococcoides goetzii]|nr:hypothetical protein [Macrococcus goetzii]TDM48281.1 hypothetical protein ETI08_03830 [Macrococcus goetzii]